MDIKNIIQKKINNALILAGILDVNNIKIRHSTKNTFGDYQVEGIIALSKKLKITPYELAKKILSLSNLEEISYKTEIKTPGFINIFLDKKWIELKIESIFLDKNLSINRAINPKIIVIDYSSPNIAKQMHVGHLRSTIIGDSVSRALEFLGHKVIRVNHIGDWGTQFGMLIAYFNKIKKRQVNDMTLQEIEHCYHKAKKLYDTDKNFSLLACKYVVKLQSGDKFCRTIWKTLVNITIKENQKIYDKLNVSLTKKNIIGESFYNDMLPKIVQDLINQKIAVKNNGAIVIYLETLKNKDGKKMGVIIQKKDGGYLYSTTEIACLKYRYETFHANRILYYTDSRQNRHLKQVWEIAKRAKYIPNSVSLEHHAFGMMLDKNKKPFQTRSGKTIQLKDLLSEAIKRATQVIKIKNPNISMYELQKNSHIIGIGALKYFDLSKNRTTDYIFQWDKMLSFSGKTALYIQYAYVRTFSILKKFKINFKKFKKSIILNNRFERKLAICLLQLEEVILDVSNKGFPHIMCSYLYNLSESFSHFYEQCSIINEKDNFAKINKLKLVYLTKKTLKIGLNILGIQTTTIM